MTPRAPLSGVKVVDLSVEDPGAFAAMLLGEFGADVVRIDPIRGATQLGSAVSAKEVSLAADQPLNRNKRSIAINLKSEHGRDAFYRLVSDADILIEGFRPGVTQRLRIDYETLRNRNPAIIYVSITGYGQDGPSAQLAGHDLNYLSESGTQYFIRSSTGEFAVPLNLLADYAGGALLATIGTLVALHGRSIDDAGRHVDISLTHSCFALLCFALGNPLGGNGFSNWQDLETSGLNPDYRIYATKGGGALSIACVEPKFWRNLCRAIGKEELLEAPPVVISSVLEEVFASKTAEEWLDELRDKDVCVAKVNSPDEALAQLRERPGSVVAVPEPDGSVVNQPGISMLLSGESPSPSGRAPIYGEHSRAILMTLGFSEKEIYEMHQSAAVYVRDIDLATIGGEHGSRSPA